MLGSILNDRYEIGQEIGRGAMAIVYLGQDIKLERPVAIKVFNDILSAKALLRAQREAQALARINHPNLVGIRSSEKDEFGRLAIVVDYIDGVALSQLIARQSLDLVTATDLFKQLCAGLGAIHAAHIVHRDIKTSNLMVQTSDKVRRLWLIDFGLAKLDDGSQQKLTSTGTLLGTPAYMSPEQYSGGDITSSSDLYSAACVLYEMLTGKQPFQSETPYLVAHKQLNEQPPPVASHGRPIQNNAAIDSFFLRALNKDPEQRFGSAQEMLHAFLEASRNGVLVKAPKAGKVPFKTVLLFAKIAGTIAIPILAAGVISILVSRSAERKSEAAALSTVRNDVEEFVHSNDHKGARRYLAQEIPELEKIQFNKNDLPQMANIYMVYSKECAADDGTLEDVEKGITATKKALKLFQETPTSSGIRDTYGRLARLHFLSGQYALSLDELKKYLELGGKGAQKTWSPDNSAAMGNCLQRLWLTDEAIDIMEKWMPKEDDILVMRGFAGQIRSACRAYMDRQNYDKALSYFKLLWRIPTTQGEERAIDAADIAFCQAMLGRSKESREWLKTAYSLDSVTGRTICMDELTEAMNLWNENKHADAERLLSQAVQDVAKMHTAPKSQQYRVKLLVQFWLYRLGKSVAKRMKDEKQIAECTNRMDILLAELIKQGALVPRSRAS